MTMHKTFARLAALTLGATVAGGSAAKADVVFPDDVIVQGSLCVGLDCVNNESFGFDTIRLKENNTRIKFQDTSASPFPSNDWQLTANDSASGGANKFSIDDVTGAKTPFTVLAGAPTNSMFVSSTGKVGLRTATPSLDLHINTGDTPAHRFEQNAGGGFTAQTWDVAGNEANFFVRDVTSGSRLPFRIRPGAPTSSIDISGTGNVGVGIASPTEKFHIDGGTGSIRTRLVANTTDLYIGQNSGTTFGIAPGGLAFIVQDSTKAFPLAVGTIGNQSLMLGTSNVERVRVNSDGNIQMFALLNCANGIVTNGSGLLSCSASSRQFKNVTGELPSDIALANVMALRPHVGAYKDSPDTPEHWFIAEQVAEVDPALVGLHEGKPFTVKTTNVVADLVAVVQQQQREINELKQRLSTR